MAQPSVEERRKPSETREAFCAALRDVALKPAGNGEDVIFSGNAVVFGSWSEPLWTKRGVFRERILPGAFDDVLEQADVRLLANHDAASVMARTKSGTLDLTADGEALRVWARLDPSDPDVQRLQPKVSRRDIDQMSFQFDFDPDRGAQERWWHDPETRELRRDVIKVSDLYDVSPATFPAYVDTTVSLRSMERALERALQSGRLAPGSHRPRPQRYARVIQVARETPWAILPSALATIFEILSLRAQGERLSEQEIRERIGTRRERPEPEQGPVAVLGLYGPIFPRANLMTEVSGATSVQTFQQDFRQALNDPAVASILLDIDSPGGLVDLVPELAAEIKAARSMKPIVAHANTLAASAAYWIASGASELVVTPSGEVGSIGVYAMHDDISGFQEKAGIKTTLISAGKYKTEANPFEPLSEEAEAAIQADVDEFYRMFTSAVASGRGVSVDEVRGGFGEGRVVGARQALALGMVDRIETFETTLARLNAGQELRSRARRKQSGAIPSHSTEVIDEPWDGPGEEAKMPNPIGRSRGRRMYAWVDPEGDEETKAAYRFPHHKVTDGDPGPANAAGCRAVLQRLPGSNIPEADKEGVRRHAQRHLDDFERRQEEGAVLEDLPEAAFESRHTLRRSLGLTVAQGDPAGRDSDPASAQVETDPAVGGDRTTLASAETDPAEMDALAALKARSRSARQQAREDKVHLTKEMLK